MKNKTTLYFLCILTAIGACRSPKPAATTRLYNNSEIDRLRDSILQEGLDGEALYTLLGDVKPMSSLVSFSFPIANADSTKAIDGHVLDIESAKTSLDKLRGIQAALNALDLPDLKFVLAPYRAAYKDRRNIQVNVVRLSLLDSLLKKQAAFFGQFGLVEGADPSVVLVSNEYGNRYDRLRGYGYLFGYPDYAVDFFVKAAFQSDTSNKHVERHFFTIPVHSREEGRFVYATPKGYTPTAVDSALYKRSTVILKQYRELRSQYLNSDSTVRAYDLLRDYFKNDKRE